MQHSRNVLGLVALVASLVLTGCAADLEAQKQATPTDSSEFHTIPRTSNQPSDPPPPDDDDQNTNSRLTPAEASLNQLWAAANMDVGEEAKPSTLGNAAGLRDFAAAISSRCYPVRSAGEVAELEELRVGYEAVDGVEAFEPGRAYFMRATDLCM